MKKSSENDQLTGHFQRGFLSFFFNISRTNSKTSKVNQQSVLNLSIFLHFPKIWTGQSLLTVSLSKLHRQNLKNKLFFLPGCVAKSVTCPATFFSFFYFPKNYSRRVCKSTNKKILALTPKLSYLGNIED